MIELIERPVFARLTRPDGIFYTVSLKRLVSFNRAYVAELWSPNPLTSALAAVRRREVTLQWGQQPLLTCRLLDLEPLPNWGYLRLHLSKLEKPGCRHAWQTACPICGAAPC